MPYDAIYDAISIWIKLVPILFRGLHGVLFAESQTTLRRDLLLARHCKHVATGLVIVATSSGSAVAGGPLGHPDRQLQRLVGPQHGVLAVADFDNSMRKDAMKN